MLCLMDSFKISDFLAFPASFFFGFYAYTMMIYSLDFIYLFYIKNENYKEL